MAIFKFRKKLNLERFSKSLAISFSITIGLKLKIIWPKHGALWDRERTLPKIITGFLSTIWSPRSKILPILVSLNFEMVFVEVQYVYLFTDDNALWTEELHDQWISLFGSPNPMEYPGLPFNYIPNLLGLSKFELQVRVDLISLYRNDCYKNYREMGGKNFVMDGLWYWFNFI